MYNIIIWILSQTAPTEGSHLIPDVRTKTRNGHHITLLPDGIFKELDKKRLLSIQLNIIGAIYDLKLQNVEHGRVNCSSVTITRVGYQLNDAMRARHLSREKVYEQVKTAVQQLHEHGYAHCDICVDNIFVDSQEDGGNVFLGDLEYCRKKGERPPVDVRRADPKAQTAEELDLLQLDKLKDELAEI